MRPRSGESAGSLVATAVRDLPRWWRATAIALTVVALGLTGMIGGAPGAVVFVAGLALAGLVALLVAEPADRALLLGIVVGAFVLRALVAAGLEGYLQLTRPGSVYAPDESIYLADGRALGEHLRDLSAPFDSSEPHLRMLYVQLIGIVFAILGPNVLVIKLLNSLAGAVAPVLLYRAMRNVGLPGARVATIGVLFFPSLLFWSTLALKDAYVELCLLAAAWTASELIRTRHYLWLAATALPLIALDSVRRYGYFAMALALLAVPLAFPTARERLRAAAAVVGMVAILFAIFDPLSDAGPNPLYLPILSRGSAAEGARSAFVEPFPVVRGNPGDTFVVAVPGRTPAPGSSPRAVPITSGTEVVIEGSTPKGSGPFVLVRPGDTLVISENASAPPPTAPGRTPEVAVLNPDAKNLVGPATIVDPDATSISGSLATNLRNLPVGMLYMAFAPFPWAARTRTELATIPEMLLWYVMLPLALAGAIVLLRRRQLGFAYGAVFAGGMFMALSLIAANTGTLIRSRAMIIPFVVALAAVGAATLFADRLPRRLRWLLA